MAEPCALLESQVAAAEPAESQHIEFPLLIAPRGAHSLCPGSVQGDLLEKIKVYYFR